MLPDEIFLLGILLLEPCISLIYAWRTNKYTNYSFSLLIMYGSFCMFRHYIAIFRKGFQCLLRDAQLRSSRQNIVDGCAVSSDVVTGAHHVTRHNHYFSFNLLKSNDI